MEDRLDRRALFWTSTSTLVLAALLATVLHEASHAVAGLVVGRTSTLYPFQVVFDGSATTGQEVATAATGPAFSLVSGLVLLAVSRTWGHGWVRLLWTWLSLVSIQNGVGYLLIAPLAPAGDTGRVLALTGAPGWVSALSLVAGVVGTLALSWVLATRVVRWTRDPDELRAIVIFPWLAATGTVVVVQLLVLLQVDAGADVVVTVLAAAVAVAIFAPMFSFFYRRVDVPHEDLGLGPPRVPLVLAAVAVLLVVLVVARGVPVG
ncbi:MAG: hypothetical protein Q7T56_08415 [Nocardioidaceae bacterium]|nr:hypothetical protein [Nocardioidaceae bacterium]